MEYSWVILVLLSAAIHPLRDVWLKNVAVPIACYLGVSLIWVILAAGHAGVAGVALTLPPSSYPMVIASAMGLGFYYYGTVAALGSGNFSVYYPIIRTSPVAIAAINWLFWDVSYSALTLLGIVLVLAGSFMMQKTQLSLWDNSKALMLATTAMLGSATYSISDALAMQVAHPVPFLFYCYVLVSLILTAIYILEKRTSAKTLGTLVTVWRSVPLRVIFAGVTSYFSYLLILRAFQWGAEAAAVASIRQASIPISVILAAVILSEKKFFSRLGWSFLIVLGILCIA